MGARGLVVVLSGRNERFDETPTRVAWAESLGVIPVQVSGENTKEEIERAIRLAGWELTLVTSLYHARRVLLTAVAALQRVGKERQVRVWVEQAPAYENAGAVGTELEKIVAYQATGDVASDADGVAYVEWRDAP